VQKAVLVMQWSPRHVPSSRWMLANRVRIDLLHFAQRAVRRVPVLARNGV
jgi:hypothetical protein